MWLTVDFEMVAIFGLRPSNTTSSGGKSLLIPTPYAIKMAVIDRMIVHGGLDYGVDRFPLVRDLTIYAGLPTAVAVTRSFQKVLRPGGKNQIWKETIVQREYCVHAGNLQLLFEIEDVNGWFAEELLKALTSVNYFGRKGGFVQLAGYSDTRIPDEGCVNLCEAASGVTMGFLQRMDDMRPDASFDDISTMKKKGNKDDGGRRQYNIILPYHLAHHGYNHSIYEVRG